MDRTCVAIAGVLAIALGPMGSSGSASATTSLSDDRPRGGFADRAPASSIGVSDPGPALVDRPPLASPSYFDDVLAQRVLDDDEKKPKAPGDEDEEEKRVLTRKSPWVAMGLSAVLPGAGQFYLDKSNPLAFAYVGVEALALYLHFAWEADGDEKTREFEEYAFQGFLVANTDSLNGYAPMTTAGHWDWQRWRGSFTDPPDGCIDPVAAGHVGTQVDSMLIEFWFNNRREFYEDIGKYDKYDCGWVNPEFRDIYRSMRNETNDILERARLMTQVVLLNHLASSIHAFFLARSHNKRVEELEREASLRQLRWRFSPDEDFRGLRAQLWLTQRF